MLIPCTEHFPKRFSHFGRCPTSSPLLRIHLKGGFPGYARQCFEISNGTPPLAVGSPDHRALVVLARSILATFFPKNRLVHRIDGIREGGFVEGEGRHMNIVI